MKKIALLVVIVVMCVPSYGSVLVYNFTSTYNGVVNYDDANYASADFTKQILQAYLVFDVNLHTGDVYVGDADDSNNPTVVLYGKMDNTKFQLALGGADPNHASTVYIDTPEKHHSFKSFNVSNKNNMEATLVTIKVQDSNDFTGINVENDMFGINSTAVINPLPLHVASIPKTLTGHLSMSNSVDFPDATVGFGTSLGTFAPLLTHTSAHLVLTVDQTVQLIQDSLTNRNFMAMREFP